MDKKGVHLHLVSWCFEWYFWLPLKPWLCHDSHSANGSTTSSCLQREQNSLLSYMIQHSAFLRYPQSFLCCGQTRASYHSADIMDINEVTRCKNRQQQNIECKVEGYLFPYMSTTPGVIIRSNFLWKPGYEIFLTGQCRTFITWTLIKINAKHRSIPFFLFLQRLVYVGQVHIAYLVCAPIYGGISAPNCKPN